VIGLAFYIYFVYLLLYGKSLAALLPLTGMKTTLLSEHTLTQKIMQPLSITSNLGSYGQHPHPADGLGLKGSLSSPSVARHIFSEAIAKRVKRVKRIEWNNSSLVVNVATMSVAILWDSSRVCILVFIKARSLRSLTKIHDLYSVKFFVLCTS